MLQLYWPIALIVLSNVVYHICSKSTPAAINPFAALTVTYLIAAASALVLYLLTSRGGNLLLEYKNLNWSSFVLGLGIVGLEAGCIYMYKAGWDISIGQLVYSALLTVCLIVIGVLVYKESFSVSKAIGVCAICAGLFLVNR